MTLNDFLSRQKHDNSYPFGVIPLSFSIQEIPHAKYYNIHESKQKYILFTLDHKQRVVV